MIKLNHPLEYSKVFILWLNPINKGVKQTFKCKLKLK